MANEDVRMIIMTPHEVGALCGLVAREVRGMCV